MACICECRVAQIALKNGSEFRNRKFLDRRAMKLKSNSGLELPANFGELADVAAIDTTALVTHTTTIQAAALPMTAVDAAAGGGLTLRAARYTAVNLAFAEISLAARTQRRGTRA